MRNRISAILLLVLLLGTTGGAVAVPTAAVAERNAESATAPRLVVFESFLEAS